MYLCCVYRSKRSHCKLMNYNSNVQIYNVKKTTEILNTFNLLRFRINMHTT